MHHITIILPLRNLYNFRQQEPIIHLRSFICTIYSTHTYKCAYILRFSSYIIIYLYNRLVYVGPVAAVRTLCSHNSSSSINMITFIAAQNAHYIYHLFVYIHIYNIHRHTYMYMRRRTAWPLLENRHGGGRIHIPPNQTSVYRAILLSRSHLSASLKQYILASINIHTHAYERR